MCFYAYSCRRLGRICIVAFILHFYFIFSSEIQSICMKLKRVCIAYIIILYLYGRIVCPPCVCVFFFFFFEFATGTLEYTTGSSLSPAI